MQTHQYLSHISSASVVGNGARPVSFHQDSNGAAVVCRLGHSNGSVGRPVTSRQSSSVINNNNNNNNNYHNRLSFRAFAGTGAPTNNATCVSIATDGAMSAFNGALTTSWPANGHLCSTVGWVNLALDANDPAGYNHRSNTLTLDKTSYSQYRKHHLGHLSNGSVGGVVPETGSLLRNGSVKRMPKLPSAQNQQQQIEEKFTISNQQIYSAILSLPVVGLPACIISILSMQLLITLSYMFSATDSNPSAIVIIGKTNEILRGLAVGLCTVSFSTSVASVLSSFLQCYLCLKMLKTINVAESKIRILLYLRSNMYLRMFIDGGFFVGIPCLLLSVIIYVHLYSNSSGTPSITSTVVTVIVGVAILLCLISVFHATYSWLCGSLNIKINQRYEPVMYDAKNTSNEINKNLSTLV